MGQRLDATIPNFPNDGQDGMVSVRSLHCGHLICHGPGKRRRGEGGGGSEVTSKEGFCVEGCQGMES